MFMNHVLGFEAGPGVYFNKKQARTPERYNDEKIPFNWEPLVPTLWHHSSSMHL